MIQINAFGHRLRYLCAMNNRIDILCRRLDLYRSYLAEAGDAAIAVTLLREIQEAELELAALREGESARAPARQRECA